VEGHPSTLVCTTTPEQNGYGHRGCFPLTIPFTAQQHNNNSNSYTRGSMRGQVHFYVYALLY